jgi:rSAM/selenodomain-associated transferase 2
MTMNSTPLISIILPVLNEAERINEILFHLRAQDRDGMSEVIVVDGDPGGSTIDAIRDRGAIKATSEKGRARQMNYGASCASGDVLLFLHADTLLPDTALFRIMKAMEDPGAVAGAFDLGIHTKRIIFRITERYVSLRTRLTRIPFGDQAFFIRREYFEKIDGYRDIPIMEDVELMARIKKRGDRIVIIPDKVMTSARRWEKEGVLYCTFRNWMLQVMYALGTPPERLARWYKA